MALSVKDLCEANEAYLSEIHDYIKRYPRPLEAFAHAWVDATRAMQAFAARHPDNALLVRYEDLVADPEAVTRKIAGFVRVDWTHEWIARALQGAATVGLGDWKTYAKGSIDADSIGRWPPWSWGSAHTGTAFPCSSAALPVPGARSPCGKRSKR